MRSEQPLSESLLKLQRLYASGAINEIEFSKARSILLGQDNTHSSLSHPKDSTNSILLVSLLAIVFIMLKDWLVYAVYYLVRVVGRVDNFYFFWSE